ncbi:hypothetical protein L218DRAFT_941984 [Marasmius fiardii PR-910]|nr:hypothetical protein L218DRAFT_941984 [Marasmius fiardii PR-910]
MTCVSVIVICIWASIHPNVPIVTRSKHWLFVYWDDLKITLISLVAPELIVLWALRQWIAARKILEKYKHYGWTKEHAYLALMGGFALYDRGEFQCHLWPEVYNQWHKDQELLAARKLEEMIVTDPEWLNKFKKLDSDFQEYHGYSIHSRSERSTSTSRQAPTMNSSATEDKGIILSRYSCLLDFFLANGFIDVDKDYINDNLSHSDAITKVIAILQTSWFIVQCVARLVQGIGLTELEVLTLAFAILNGVTYVLWWSKPQRVRHPIRIQWRRFEGFQEPLGLFTAYQWRNSGHPHRPWLHLLYFCFPIVWFAFFLSAHAWDLGIAESGSLVYSGLEIDPPWLRIATAIITVLFGALHCIAWNIAFPTDLERYLWRLFAAFVTVLPVGAAIFYGFMNAIYQSVRWGCFGWHSEEERDTHPLLSCWTFTSIQLIPVYIPFALYALARVGLIVLALMELRNLPLSAYQSVDWVQLIPHFG